MRLKFKLEQRHIDYGFKGICARCPLALAISESLGLNIGSVEITPDGIYINGTQYRIPPELMERMEHFDSTGKMTPFSYEAKLELL